MNKKFEIKGILNEAFTRRLAHIFVFYGAFCRIALCTPDSTKVRYIKVDKAFKNVASFFHIEAEYVSTPATFKATLKALNKVVNFYWNISLLLDIRVLLHYYLIMASNRL